MRWGEATDKEQGVGWEQATGRVAPGDCSPRAPMEPDLWGAWVGDHPGLPGPDYYPGNKEGHIPTRSASEGPMKSSESRRGSPLDD